MTAQTSIDSYHKLAPSQVDTEISQIIQFLKENDRAYSLREISQKTGLALNVVWSRTNTLFKRGLITYAGIAHDYTTDRDVMTWKAKP